MFVNVVLLFTMDSKPLTRNRPSPVRPGSLTVYSPMNFKLFPKRSTFLKVWLPRRVTPSLSCVYRTPKFGQKSRRCKLKRLIWVTRLPCGSRTLRLATERSYFGLNKWVQNEYQKIEQRSKGDNVFYLIPFVETSIFKKCEQVDTRVVVKVVDNLGP